MISCEPKPIKATKASRFFKLSRNFINSLIILSTILFCLIFTSPGNQFIAYIINKTMPGVTIDLPQGRFLYQDPFSIDIHSETFNVNVNEATLDLNVGQCLWDQIAFYKETVIECPLTLHFTEFKFYVIAGQDTHDLQLQDGKLNLSVDYKQDKYYLHIANSALSQLKLDQVITQTDQQTTAFLPIQDIQFDSPVSLKITDTVIGKVILKQNSNQQNFDDIHINSKVLDEALIIEQLSFKYQDFKFVTSGNIVFSPANLMELDLEINHDTDKLKAQLRGGLSDLKLFVETKGQLPSVIQGQINLQQTNYPFKLHTSITNWQTRLEQQPVQIDNLSAQVSGDIKAYKVQLNSQQQISAYPKSDLSLTGFGDLTHFTFEQLVVNTLQSELKMSGDVAWQDQLAINLKAQASKVNLVEYNLDYVTDLTGDFQVIYQGNENNWLVRVPKVHLKGAFQKFPIDLNGQFSFDQKGHSDITQIKLTSGANYVSLAGKVKEKWQLAAKFNITDATQVSPDIIGFGTGDIKVSGARFKPKLTWKTEFNQIKYQDYALGQLLSQGSILAADNYDTELLLTMHDGRFNDKKINQLHVNVNGNKSGHHANFKLESDWLNAYSKLAGFVDTANILHTKIAETRIQFKNKIISPVRNIDLQFDIVNQDLVLKPHCWQSTNSKVCLDYFNGNKNDGKFKLNVDQFDFNSISELFPRGFNARGLVTGNLLGEWQHGKIRQLKVELDSQQLELAIEQEQDLYLLPIKQAQLNLHSNEELLYVESIVQSELFGTIKTAIEVSDLLGVNSLNGNVNLKEVKLDKFKPFIRQLDSLSGEVTADLTLSGHLLSPMLAGKVNANNIALSGRAIPFSIVNSYAELDFKQQGANITAQVFDSKGGKVELKGNMNWLNDILIADANLKGQAFNLELTQGIKLKVDSDVTMAFDGENLNLGGKILIPYGRIEIKELPQGAVEVSGDEIIFEQRIVSNKKPINYALDLLIEVKDDVRFNSFGLSSKLVGLLKLKQTYQGPLIASGDINIIDGVYQSFGQDLQIQTGQIGFSGAIDKPFLNIKAIRNPKKTADGVIAGIRLSGRIEQPKFEVFSEPGLDQAMALSYLLNGQPLGEGNSANNNMLKQLLLSNGLSRSEGIVNKIGYKLGFEDVTIGSQGAGNDTKVEISGYLNPDVQIRYSVGVFDPVTEVVVRYQLLPQLYLEAINGVYDSLDILYKFEWH